MKQVQRGFTLIELVMVIVILGVLAAVALPKFTDLSEEAKVAATQGVAGALSSAAVINYGARSANSAKGDSVAKCSDTFKLLQTTPTGYTKTGTDTTVASGVTETGCQVAGPGGQTATFTAIGI